MDLLTSGEEVSACVFSPLVRRNPSSQFLLRELGLSGELPDAGALRKGNGLCNQTGVLSLTLTGPVSVCTGSGSIRRNPGPNLCLIFCFSLGPMKSPVSLSGSCGLKDRTNFDHSIVFDPCSGLSLTYGREKKRLRLD